MEKAAGDWNHGLDYDFPYIVGNGKSNFIIPTDN
jgi:hypothetical protein